MSAGDYIYLHWAIMLKGQLLGPCSRPGSMDLGLFCGCCFSCSCCNLVALGNDV